MAPSPDPYRTLGVARSATDAELRAAYRRMVQLHHPDHNGGSAETGRRLESVQDGYAEAPRLRAAAGGGARATGTYAGSAGPEGAGSRGAGSGGAGADPNLDARLQAMEQELR